MTLPPRSISSGGPASVRGMGAIGVARGENVAAAADLARGETTACKQLHGPRRGVQGDAMVASEVAVGRQACPRRQVAVADARFEEVGDASG